MIIKKSPAEIETMARAGRVVARANEAVMEAVAPGVSTADLDAIAERVIRSAGAVPSFKGYRGFPATVCASVGREIVHGIPSRDVVLRAGDVLSIDCGAIVDEFHGDSAFTIIVGGEREAAPEVAELVDATHEAMWRGLASVLDGNRLGDIGSSIEAVATANGHGVVREYVGHGIGRSLHEDPSVPNYGRAGKGLRLSPGWVIAIEPMFTLGSPQTRLLDDGWTVVTADGSLSAHWEHTVALTEDGPRVLTAREGEPVDPTQREARPAA
ncbi:MAG: type methionyl aminopeptidase [Actinomycetota bacterium]|jgi:methionyl aminopeptidase